MTRTQQSKRRERVGLAAYRIACGACGLLVIVTAGCGGGGQGVGGSPTPDTGAAEAPALQGPIAYLTTGKGAPTGVPTTAAMGPAGGTLSSADGRLTLAVPAGALGQTTLLSITAIAQPADNAVASYRLEPDGTAFAVPVTLTYSLPGAGASSTGLSAIGLTYHDAEGHWRWLPVSRDEAAKTITAQLEHFSDYSYLRGFQLTPQWSRVDVLGTQKLQVQMCADSEVFDPQPQQLVGTRARLLTVYHDLPPAYECRPMYFKGAKAIDWSVNGVPDGNLTVGLVSDNHDLSAIYGAPATQPKPDTVSVVAQFLMDWRAAERSERVYLVAQVQVGPSNVYAGEFRARTYNSAVGTWTARGNAVWTRQEDKTLGDFVVKGTVVPDQTQYVLGDQTCTLNAAEQSFTNDAATINTNTTPPTIAWRVGLLQWSATCCGSHGCSQVPSLLRMSWYSHCAGAGIVEWASLDGGAYPDALKGTYTWPSATCVPVFAGMDSTTVEWSFSKPGGQ